MQPQLIDVWPLRLDLHARVLDSLRLTLAEDELSRAARLRSAHVGARFVAGRGQLRQILGGMLDRDPASLRFTYGQFGKPSLPDAPSLYFNLSHSGELGLLAVAEHAELGVDIESNHARERGERIARRFFAPLEIEELMSLPSSERDGGFLRCWTRKEAYVKALGGGLQTPLDGFAVSLASEESTRLRWSSDPGELRRWTLIDLSHVHPDATAAVCVASEAARVHVRMHEADYVSRDVRNRR